jgi:hypothetical protein
MTSSISSSEFSLAAWRRWLATFLAVLVMAGAGLFAAIAALDPYDTGRFALLPSVGVLDDSPRTAVASRGRDPRFDAAIIGSSTGQLLDPRRLSQATGRRFVQLTIPGTRPREQLTVMRYFLGHHPRIGALVLVADESWCNADPALPIANPFPFWLYADSTLEYLGNIFGARTLDRVIRQLQIRIGLRSRSDPAGYADYEAGRAWNFHPESAPPATALPELADGAAAPFPAIGRLRDLLRRLGPDVPAVVLMPPTYASHVPPSDAPAGQRLAACKTALADVVAGRTRGGFLDFRAVNATTRDPRSFMDVLHYRSDVARRIERAIASAIATGRASTDL